MPFLLITSFLLIFSNVALVFGHKSTCKYIKKFIQCYVVFFKNNFLHFFLIVKLFEERVTESHRKNEGEREIQRQREKEREEREILLRERKKKRLGREKRESKRNTRAVRKLLRHLLSLSTL